MDSTGGLFPKLCPIKPLESWKYVHNSSFNSENFRFIWYVYKSSNGQKLTPTLAGLDIGIKYLTLNYLNLELGNPQKFLTHENFLTQNFF